MKSAIKYLTLIPLLGGLFLFSITVPARGQKGAVPSTIIDFYNLLPGKKFELEQKRGKWITKSCADYDIEPLVDLRNGYLSIEDPGTGGGTIVQEAALFLTSDRRFFLGVSLTEFDGIGARCGISIFEYRDKAMKDVTASVLPDIDLDAFMPPGYDMAALKKKATWVDSIQFGYTLPRHGTTVKVSMVLTTVSSRLNIAKSQEEPVDMKTFEEFQNSIRFEAVELNWNMKKGKFEIGRKIVKKQNDHPMTS